MPTAAFELLKPTPVYDTYWRFAAERQLVFFRRLGGSPPPWTEDPVLARHKFTNAYRASDRTSQYLIRRVIYRDDLPADVKEVVFRILLFKVFNRIGTWELLETKLGPLTYADFSVKDYDRVLSEALRARTPIYSAAYIMPPAGFGRSRKHQNHLLLIRQMISDDLPSKVADAASMQEAFNLLRRYRSVGDFLAYQYVTDINYSWVTNFSEAEFVVPGPGALDGIHKCFGAIGDRTPADVIRIVARRQSAEFERLGLNFQTLWGRPLQLIDCQNLFCEVGKYARVVHPEVAGISNRVRIKQNFKPTESEIPSWYPPKWGLNAALLSHAPNSVSDVRMATVGNQAMDLRTYQERASKTDRSPGNSDEARMIPLAGLASETGELLGEYKKYLRDGAHHKLFKVRLAEEIGDLLWYVANVATKFELDLGEVASQNLAKTEQRWGSLPARKAFDAGFPKAEQLPRRFSVKFATKIGSDGVPQVSVTYKGRSFGDDLTDNAYTGDGYGYHDVLHLAFAAVLGWSPLVRKMIGAKRKSIKEVDHVEDGGRAIAVEEGLATMIFAYARDYEFLEGKSSVSSELLRMIKNMVSHLEASACTTAEWEGAMIQGFAVWRALKLRGKGVVDLDLDARRITLRDA
ncbi:MAG: nucleotide kinase domain-containing protein [Gemmatimonadaceae bacterium]